MAHAMEVDTTDACLLLTALAFVAMVHTPVIYTLVREAVRPWAIREVEREKKWIQMIQRYHTPLLDVVLEYTSTTCGLPFYISFLPCLYWAGELRLARDLTILCALSVYVGNSLKDIVCSPRPEWGGGIRLVCSGQYKYAHEYGLPSTHTFNTVSVCGYLVWYYSASWPMIALAVSWCCLVAYSRVYLGMHSPVDVATGLLLSGACLAYFIPLSAYLDQWVGSPLVVPVYQLLLSLALIKAYPKPLRPTPSYEYHVYFTGVALGVVTGLWHSGHLHSADTAVAIAKLRGEDLFTTRALIFTLRRFVPGLIATVITRAVAKPLAQSVLSLFLSPMSPSTLTNQQRKPIEVMLTYAVVGYVVVDPCFHMFKKFGI
eukprot:TRINITY_DN15769_c0_g1_i1.p1 TRINITY_DN15769_c0_g1~~TRINITY_DN15769_c0_g1_i1.p1  ORF type:complete len:373 (+),score=86.36 TRINITY_DN15769_c0_g1_i1:33-1151(+)